MITESCPICGAKGWHGHGPNPATKSEYEIRISEADRIANWITAVEQNDKSKTDMLILLADALRSGDHRG